MSDDHFSVDATLIETWASLKSFKPKGTDQGTVSGNSWTDSKGEQRGNAMHESTTDAEAKLVPKGPGKEARLSFAGHATMENRHGLCVLFEVRPAVGAPEWAVAVDQAVELRNRGLKPRTIGGDKGYHTAEFVTGLRALGIVPNPALKAGQRTLRAVCAAAHAASQKVRKRIEEIFGWAKTTGGFRKSRYRGVERTHAHGQYVVATWNLVRMAKLMLSGQQEAARARRPPGPRCARPPALRPPTRRGPRRERRENASAEPMAAAKIMKSTGFYIKRDRFFAVC